MRRIVTIILLALLARPATAALPGIVSWETEQNLETVYREVYMALEKNRFYVVFEPNLSMNMARLAQRWDDDYNRNQLREVRSMVFYNAWYTNQIGNIEPELLAMCPLQVSLYRQGTVTHVAFVRPTHIGEGSKTQELLGRIEADVSAAIRQGIDAAEKLPVRYPTTR
jgi:hypothetical protein